MWTFVPTSCIINSHCGWGYRVYCSHYTLNFPLSLVLSTFFKSSSICLNISIPLCALLNESSYRLLRLLISASLTLSWWRLLSYRNQSIDLQSKSMAWFHMIKVSVMKGLTIRSRFLAMLKCISFAFIIAQLLDFLFPCSWY